MAAKVRYASDYSADIVSASLSVLIEVLKTLATYADWLVLIGGWAPFFILKKFQQTMNFKHVGSIDIDIAVHPEIISQDKYATIVELLGKRGYRPAKYPDGRIKEFSFEREVGGYIVGLDFLTSEKEKKRRHRRVQPDLRARTSYGVGVVFSHNFLESIAGVLPNDGRVKVQARIADLVGCLATKGILLGSRYKGKDAYDIFSLVTNYKRGARDASIDFKRYLGEPLVREGFNAIKTNFADIASSGPAWVGAFLFPNDAEGRKRTAAEAYIKVSEFVKAVEP